MPEAPKWGWHDDHPMVNVSWEDAQAFCRWAGLALPTEEQWEKAARGTDGRVYPWGDRWDTRRCVCKAKATAPVGSKPEGASPYGCLDMAGNVWEWCSDWYDGNKDTRCLRGGSWSCVCPEDFRCALRHHNPPGHRGDYSGFRCARTG